MGQGYSAQGSAAGSTTAKTAVYVRPPSKVDLKIVGWSVTLDSATAGAGAKVEIGRITTLGTPTATSYTPDKRNPYGPASDTLGAKVTVTGSEPTMTTEEVYYIAPNGGGLIKQYPLGRERIYKANDSNDAFAIRVTLASGTSANVAVSVEWEEGA